MHGDINPLRKRSLGALQIVRSRATVIIPVILLACYLPGRLDAADSALTEGKPASGEVVVVLSDELSVTLSRGDKLTAGGVKFAPAGVFQCKTNSESVRSETDRLLSKQADGTWTFTIKVNAEVAGSVGMVKKGTAFVPDRPPISFVKMYAADDFSGGSDGEQAPAPRKPGSATTICSLAISEWPPKQDAIAAEGGTIRYAFVRQRGNQAFVVLDGKESAEGFDAVEQLQFSANGSQLYYFGFRGIQGFLVSEKGLKALPVTWVRCWDARMVVSSDGRSVAYYYDTKLYRDGKLVMDGLRDEDKGFLGQILAASPDLKSIAWTGGRDLPGFDIQEGLFLDGKFFSDLPAEMLFSPDGSRFLAHCRIPRVASYVLLDGKAGLQYSTISSPTFSPDSKHYAFVAVTRDNKAVIVRDGVEHVLLHGGPAPKIWFSADSRHLFLMDIDYGQAMMDESELGRFARSPGGEFAIRDDGKEFLFSSKVAGGKENGYVVVQAGNGRRVVRLAPKSTVSFIGYVGDNSIVVARDASVDKASIWINGAPGKYYDDVILAAQHPSTPAANPITYIARDGQSLCAVVERCK